MLFFLGGGGIKHKQSEFDMNLSKSNSIHKFLLIDYSKYFIYLSLLNLVTYK